jgi:hypothetical protein
VMRFASGSRGTSSTPSPSYVIVQLWEEGFVEDVDWDREIVIWSSRKIERAKPTTSKPGPMFAEEQGTRILNLGIVLLSRALLQFGNSNSVDSSDEF